MLPVHLRWLFHFTDFPVVNPLYSKGLIDVEAFFGVADRRLRLNHMALCALKRAGVLAATGPDRG